ncbi:hypothetical protein RSSE_c3457 [Ralstonia solanacearum]|nr:hypothetical protein RSSE_c3457 [Ralstonia solanacearum]
MPFRSLRNDYWFNHVIKLIGGDIDNQGSTLQPGVRPPAPNAEHIVERSFSMLLKELSKQQCSITTRAGGETLERDGEA